MILNSFYGCTRQATPHNRYYFKHLYAEAFSKQNLSLVINKHTQEHFHHQFALISKVFTQLNGDTLGNQSKRTVSLDCDAYFGGQFNFLFEFDEFRRFTSARSKTLELYPSDLQLNFDIKQWKKYCQKNMDKADKYRQKKTTVDFTFPGGRTAQRAYLDCFRDLLPTIHGLRPTLRISEFEVADIFDNNADSCRKLEKIIKQKLLY